MAPAVRPKAGDVPPAAPHHPGGRIGELSVGALRSCAHLDLISERALASYLYRFNTLPASPPWRRMYPSHDALVDQLRTPLVSWNADDVGRAWTLVDDTDVSARWWVWKRSGRRVQPSEFRRSPTYKLYVSPAPLRLRDAFHATLASLTDSRALALKLGRDLPGVLRPDKLVVYFACRDDLLDATVALRSSLSGLAAHGVPFTAALGDDGLLSWGVDPPEVTQSFAPRGAESWRVWLTRRLARSLRSTDAVCDPTIPPWSFALAQLALEGVDPSTFVPREDRWSPVPQS